MLISNLSYTCVMELILVFQILYGAYSGTKVPVGTTQIPFTEVLVSTTGLILVLWNLYLFYRYRSTRRYYWTYTYFTDTGVPVGTTGLILILQNLYLFY